MRDDELPVAEAHTSTALTVGPQTTQGLAIAFWLPCGQANFIRSDEDEEIINSPGPLTNYQSSARSSPHERRLEASVVRRLVETLGSRGYTEYLFPSADEHSSTPTAIALRAPSPRLRSGEPLSALENATLLVSQSGQVVCLAPDANSDNEAHRTQVLDHIVDLVGGSFCSHNPGRTDDPGVTLLDEVDRSATLRDYVDQDVGYLNFFQINIILEGLFNANFDPTVFFHASEAEEAALTSKRSHSLGEFVRAISTKPLPVEVPASAQTNGDGAPFSATEWHWGLLTKPSTRHASLDRFVRATSTRTLLATKWRIERCRRALLNDLLGVVHRRQPVLQVESPDANSEMLRGISEMQVRGYVMLLAAKLPLLHNVERYTTREWKSLPDGYSEIRSELDNWQTLLEALSDNIAGLEATIAQASRDRLLYEEEQVRAEQEAAGELARLQEREGSSSDDISFSAAEVLLAFSALIFTLGQGFEFTGWSLAGAALVTLILAPIAILCLHKGMSMWFERVSYKRFLRDPLDGRFLYEADVRADEVITAAAAERIIRGDLILDDSVTDFAPSVRRLGKPRRNSYRVERISKDESVHKVHVECIVTWSQTTRRAWRRRVDEMLLHVTYELMFHRPSDDPSHILREVRALGTMPRRLDNEELMDFRRLVAQGFINALRSSAMMLSTGSERPDSMLALEP